MILITGGSGSGKSAYAEDCVLGFKIHPRTYIATMFPYDEESLRRVERHQKMRSGKGFFTIECYTGLKNLVLKQRGTVLLECMSNLVANELFLDGGAGENTVEEILEGVRSLKEQSENLVIVTNEVFSDAALYEGEMETYLKFLGEINVRMAEMADQVTEVVYGIPVHHKKEMLTGEKPLE